MEKFDIRNQPWVCTTPLEDLEMRALAVYYLQSVGIKIDRPEANAWVLDNPYLMCTNNEKLGNVIVHCFAGPEPHTFTSLYQLDFKQLLEIIAKIKG
jgi:hypothetical protein